MSASYVWAGILTAAAVTVMLRALPFVLFGGGRKTPDVVTYLGKVLPCAVMAMLVVYCLRDTSLSVSSWLPRFIASAVTCGLYVLKRNSLLSIALGTACYMLLVQLVF
ncbi:MAG: AzlD domain-containing protein [Firmicutes bacterium]|nr:AzlD domain-containing protein [Bacillota bacterium]